MIEILISLRDAGLDIDLSMLRPILTKRNASRGGIKTTWERIFDTLEGCGILINDERERLISMIVNDDSESMTNVLSALYPLYLNYPPHQTDADSFMHNIEDTTERERNMKSHEKEVPDDLPLLSTAVFNLDNYVGYMDPIFDSSYFAISLNQLKLTQEYSERGNAISCTDYIGEKIYYHKS